MNSERKRSRLVSRRRALQLAGVGTAALAGCLGDGDDTTTEENGDENSGGDADASQTDTDGPDEEQTDGDSASEGDEADPGIETELPITGQQVPALADFDEAMVSFIEEFEIGAGVLGVARDGEVVLERGYGWADEAETTKRLPTPFSASGASRSH
jgi:hypothetical protein